MSGRASRGPTVNPRQLNVKVPGGTVHARAADSGVPACMRDEPVLRACARYLEPTGEPITCNQWSCRMHEPDSRGIQL